jgi:hypothetical protein
VCGRSRFEPPDRWRQFPSDRLQIGRRRSRAAQRASGSRFYRASLGRSAAPTAVMGRWSWRWTRLTCSTTARPPWSTTWRPTRPWGWSWRWGRASDAPTPSGRCGRRPSQSGSSCIRSRGRRQPSFSVECWAATWRTRRSGGCGGSRRERLSISGKSYGRRSMLGSWSVATMSGVGRASWPGGSGSRSRCATVSLTRESRRAAPSNGWPSPIRCQSSSPGSSAA